MKELGLEPLFRSIPGDEITTDASRLPFGHANVFPLVPDPSDPRGGAVPVRDRTAHEVFEQVRGIPGHPIIQINHPRAGHRIGYFEELKFDPRRGVGDGAGYDAGFDAIEVWSGRHARERDKVLADFWALLRTGHPVTPTANTDTHGVVMQEAGYPRTYVRVADDDPARLEVGSLLEGLRVRRDVVLTNGPFIALGGAAPGALLTLGATALAIRVHVEHAPWVDAAELIVVADGAPSDRLTLPPAKPTPGGAAAHDVVITLRRRQGGADAGRFVKAGSGITVELSRDAAVLFVVVGHRPLEPVLAPSAEPDEILPFAMMSPIRVDVDGDGKSLEGSGHKRQTVDFPEVARRSGRREKRLATLDLAPTDLQAALERRVQPGVMTDRIGREELLTFRARDAGPHARRRGRAQRRRRGRFPHFAERARPRWRWRRRRAGPLRGSRRGSSPRRPVRGAPVRAVFAVLDMLSYHLTPGRAVEVPRARGIVPASGPPARARPTRPVIDPVRRAPGQRPRFQHGTCIDNVAGTQGAEIWPELAAHPGDHIVKKSTYSAFTGLEPGGAPRRNPRSTRSSKLAA